MIRNPKNLVRYFGKLFSDFFIVAIIYSSIQVMNNYEIKFLNYLKVTPELIGIIYAGT